MCICGALQAADSVEAARAAPFVEKLVADGYEVLYLTEAIDEAMVTNLAKYGDHELVDVSKEGIKLGDEDAEKKVRGREGGGIEGGDAGSGRGDVGVMQRLQLPGSGGLTPAYSWSVCTLQRLLHLFMGF